MIEYKNTARPGFDSLLLHRFMPVKENPRSSLSKVNKNGAERLSIG
jgi:hypothetical protein